MPQPQQSDLGRWLDPRMLATPLFCLAADRYPEFLGSKEDPDGWDPETLALEIRDDCGIAPPKGAIDKVFAAKAVVCTDRFHSELKPFIDICNVLSGSPYNPGVFDPADAAECAWGVTEAMVLYPLDEGNRPETYSREIVAYVAHVLKEEGISKPPGILRDLGIPDNDSAADGWEDDPTTFGAIWEMQNDKTKDIEETVGRRLALMRDQLRSLQLHNGSAEKLISAISKFLAHFGL